MGKNKIALLLFISSGLFWLLFGSYVHIQTVLKFEFLTLYLILLTGVTSGKILIRNFSYFSLLACNIVFMFIFYHRFLSGSWVG